MIDFNRSPFGQRQIRIPDDAEVVFVADAFAEDYVGGAELTSEALIEKKKDVIRKLRSVELAEHPELIKQHQNKFWIFGNFAQLFQKWQRHGNGSLTCHLDTQLLKFISDSVRYAVIEYDYKFCVHRSPEKHFDLRKEPCICQNEDQGKLISEFYAKAQHVFWMSQKQLNVYTSRFPMMSPSKNTVLSSVFGSASGPADDPNHKFGGPGRDLLDVIRDLRKERNAYSVVPNRWFVLETSNWIKGMSDAREWCTKNNKDVHLVGNISYLGLLRELATCEGLVFLPSGGDTCPRLVIEAKLLGLKLHINDNVQHADECWFATDDICVIEDYLRRSPTRFWNIIESIR